MGQQEVAATSNQWRLFKLGREVGCRNPIQKHGIPRRLLHPCYRLLHANELESQARREC